MWTTVVGNYPKIPNLPREARLRKAITSFDKGKITKEGLENVANEVTVEAIQEQVGAGIDIVTDGQIRWDDAQTAMAKGLQGFQINGLIRYFDTNTYYRQPFVVEPVAWSQSWLVDDLKFAIANSDRPVKAVLTGPLTLARLSLDKHYGDPGKLVGDIAKALNAEAKALAAAGAEMVQFDEPHLARHHEDLALLVDAAPALLDGISCKTALVTYFGDLQGIFGPLQECGFDVIGLDFATNDRNWAVIEGEKIETGIAAGIVDARNTRLETPDRIAGLAKRLLEKVPSDKLYLSPSAGLEFLPRERAEEKLKNLVAAKGMVENGG